MQYFFFLFSKIFPQNQFFSLLCFLAQAIMEKNKRETKSSFVSRDADHSAKAPRDKDTQPSQKSKF